VLMHCANHLLTVTENSEPTMTSECCPPLSTKCSRALSHNSTHRSLLLSERWYVRLPWSTVQRLIIRKLRQVSRLVRDNLMKRARRFNLILDDVSITHVAFSPEFTHAVEAKQVAQQIAQRAAFLVDQAIQEKVGCG
jgi:hypothetical protein